MPHNVIEDDGLHAGDDIDILVTVRKRSDNSIQDISAITAARFMLADDSGGPALFTKSLGSGIAIADGPAGELSITLDPGDTLGLNGRYYMEADMALGGQSKTILDGELPLAPTVLN